MYGLVVAASILLPVQHAETDAVLPDIAKATHGMQALPGYFPLYWDAHKGRLLVEIDKWDMEFLYVNWMATGIGSNDIGLDRGQPGESRVVAFRRTGPRVLLVQPNYAYRAESANPDERRAAREAFAESVLWGFDVMAEGEGGRALVDATAFFLRDGHDVIGVLRQAQQGTFKLDGSRSALYLPRTRNFPRNTEVEATLTYTSEAPGPLVKTVTPLPGAVTVRQHHSWIHLPDAGYRPRAFDPRAGYFDASHIDFAVPLGEPIEKRWIIRHRLRKQNSAEAQSAAVKPLVYYVDRGAPEPIRTALVEGARWWNQAFEAAGFKDAFRVELLPEGADPMDVRYHVIEWVHRSTRGWSYGNAITDPRTGEIINGHVNMDSQRGRQDWRILEALLAPYGEGKTTAPEIERVVLARLRQLSAHEVGHTLGLAHNFAASTYGRASVMDYPAPLVRLRDDGTFDLSGAYAEGIGAWDRVAIEYGYREFPDGTDESRELNAILQRALEKGMVFITDPDARPEQGAAAHPLAHLWDNGPNAVDELERLLRLRARALERFGTDAIRIGQPWSTLEERLVLIYLFHRYQTEAAAKLIGGLDYTYGLRGDGQLTTAMVSPKEQLRALEVVLRTLGPDVLALPEGVLRLVQPQAYGFAATPELFAKRTAPAFDALGAAECAANASVRLLLDPARAARLVEYHGRNADCPSLGLVLDRLLNSTWFAAAESGYRGEIRRVVDDVVLYHLMALAANEQAAGQVRALAYLKMKSLKNWLSAHLSTGEESQQAHAAFALARIERFEKEPTIPTLTKPLEPPPGQPIGADGD